MVPPWKCALNCGGRWAVHPFSFLCPFAPQNQPATEILVCDRGLALAARNLPDENLRAQGKVVIVNDDPLEEKRFRMEARCVC